MLRMLTCKATMTCEDATIGSTTVWGMAAWPPRPLMVIWNCWQAPMRGPARLASVPEGMKGHTWSPKIDSTPSKAPEHTPNAELQWSQQDLQGGTYVHTIMQ